MSEQLESIRRKYEEYEDKGYDKSYEDDWKQMLNDLNNLKIKVYKEKMFSDNEEFQDVKTEEIKFMLIAFLQSEIIQKFQINRKNILEFGLKFYDEFFKLLQTYNYLSKDQIKKYKYLTEKNEEGIYETDFIKCILWGIVAENTAEWCYKGDIVGVKDRIQSNNGKLEVVAEKVTFLSSNKRED